MFLILYDDIFINDPLFFLRIIKLIIQTKQIGWESQLEGGEPGVFF